MYIWSIMSAIKSLGYSMNKGNPQSLQQENIGSGLKGCI